MKMNVYEYKGYHTIIEFDAEACKLRGKIEGINDYVDFETANMSEIENEFHLAVDDYLEFCKEVGKEPEKEYKGTFNVRIAPELHRQIANLASKNGESLNAVVEKAIKAYVTGETINRITNAIQNICVKSNHGTFKTEGMKKTGYNNVYAFKEYSQIKSN